MTRKHFIELAATLAKLKPNEHTQGANICPDSLPRDVRAMEERC